MLKRLFAVLTTLVLAAGLTIGVSAAASAHTPKVTVTCTTLDVELLSYGQGTTNYVTVTIDGSVVENHTQFGNNFAKKSYTMPAGASHTYKVEIDAEHNDHDKLGAKAITGTWIPCASTGLTCDVSTLYKGSPLSNGDHINMNVTHNGGAVFQVNAYVDIRQSSDPASESGLVLRLKLESGNTVVALTNAQVASGILSFEYSKSWTGTWTIQWVQYNSSYFNQNNDASTYKNCAKDTPVSITAVPTSSDPTCSVDGALVLPTPPTGITWSGGTNGAGPGTYTITANVATGYTLNGAQDSWVVQVLPKGTGLSCGPPPCIASTQVSYTYNPATNSGTVTVPNPAGSSGKLCDGFWVTAVSWKYTTSGVWPQSLDQNNPMPEKNGAFFVDEPGSYPYGATVACGQGDIYASYDQQPVPTAVLNGPNNPYAEHFLHDMGFSGPTPTYVQSTPGCNKATPVPPTAKAISACDTDGTLTYGPTTGVVYTLTVGNGTSGAWEVTATPAPNYYFAGSQVVTYDGNLGVKTDCAESVKPVLTDAVCTKSTGIVTSAYITVPETEGLEYRIGTTLLVAGDTVDLPIGLTTVTVTEKDGYTNTGATSFDYDIAEVPDCDDPVEYVVPKITHEICDATTGVVSPAELSFTWVEHLTYEVDGTPVVFGAGETTAVVAVSAGTHTITYSVTGDFYLKGTDGLTELSEDILINAPESCDDPDDYIAPEVTNETCDVVVGGAKDGVVTFTLPAHLSYVFDGVAVTAADLTIEKPAGVYKLVVTAEDGYYITGGGTTAEYDIEVLEPEAACDEVTTISTAPSGAPAGCVIDDLTGEGSVGLGTVTIVKAEHVTWKISNDLDGVKHALDTTGPGPQYVFDFPVGNYTVWATPDAGYTLVGKSQFPVPVTAPAIDCDLPTEAFLPTGASWTNQVCATGGLVEPTITVEPFPGVSYFIDGVLVTKNTTTVKVGEHLIEAVADDPANTVETASWKPTLLAAATLCTDLTTLALTGATPGGFAILAIVLLQGGLVLVAIRFVRLRRARARHLVG